MHRSGLACLSFLSDFPRIFILAQPDKFCVTQAISVRPGKSLASKLVISQGYYAVHDVVAACAVLGGFTDE